MRVLRKEPGGPWKPAEVENELKALQREVGGYLESLTFAEDACILCDEEGQLKGKPYNTTICGVSFVGTILLVGVAGEDFTDLTVVYCKDCKHVMFSDCYAECSQGHLGIVKPNYFCPYGERKENNPS